MKSIVPYTKEIKFASKIAEICSISLEPEINIGDTEIEGKFVISGEYKSHKISVNKDSFNYELPFSVDVTDKIKDSIEFEVTDFTYEIVDESILKVDIEFSVTAEEKIEEEPLIKEEVMSREEMEEEITDLLENKEVEEILEPTIDIDNDISLILDEVSKEEVEEENSIEDERLDQESADMILNTANEKEDEFTTYYIHLVKTGDTIESIIANYQTDLETIKKYNMLEELNIGDKIIIPSKDE